jgi:hypothetical protein
MPGKVTTLTALGGDRQDGAEPSGRVLTGTPDGLCLPEAARPGCRPTRIVLPTRNLPAVLGLFTPGRVVCLLLPVLLWAVNAPDYAAWLAIYLVTALFLGYLPIRIGPLFVPAATQRKASRWMAGALVTVSVVLYATVQEFGSADLVFTAAGTIVGMGHWRKGGEASAAWRGTLSSRPGGGARV